MLEVRGLEAGYGRATVLFDVSLDVADGEAVALLGRNGAGKSTALKAIAGWLTPSRGDIRLDGRRIDGVPSYRIARAGLGYRTRGPAHLHRIDRRAKPRGRTPRPARRSAVDAAARSCGCFPRLAELQRSPRRRYIRRRAANAGDRAHSDGQSHATSARRAGRRPCAADRRTQLAVALRELKRSWRVDTVGRAEPRARRHDRRPGRRAGERPGPL